MPEKFSGHEQTKSKSTSKRKRDPLDDNSSFIPSIVFLKLIKLYYYILAPPPKRAKVERKKKEREEIPKQLEHSIPQEPPIVSASENMNNDEGLFIHFIVYLKLIFIF